MITKTQWKKCPSVSRKGKWFYYNPDLKLWIVENPLSGCWFFEKETDKTPVKTIVSRVYFRTPKIAIKWLDDGNQICW